MANIKPFKGIRPAKDKVHLVASRSVDTYTLPELNAKLAENPYTFLHIIKPKLGAELKVPTGSPEYLKSIKAKYEDFLKEDILSRESERAYYIYRQEKDGHTYTGVIGCASIDDYLSGTIKVHEQTITDKEEKLRDYLEICDFNAEPVCFTYPPDQEIDLTVKEATIQEPVYDFTTTDKVRHKLWVISDKLKVDIITERFKNIPAIYIADGHHRSASSALLGKKKRENGYTGKEAFNYFLGVFFPENQLKIYDFNRVVKDLNGLSPKEFLDKISEKFDIEEKKENLYKPVKKHNFSLYMEGKWYSLTAKKNIYHEDDPVGNLDASLLSEYILGPILGITDLKTDKRIAFVSGSRGMEELKKQVDSGKMKAAFGLYPVSMNQLKHIADTNNTMPPKTTWIEPKMRSGLVIYSLCD
jgi:uncharacterized protein (DUF1015 family)